MPDALTCLTVVTFLDEGAFLPRFLASLDGQVRRPDRLLLVDDGSTDDSLPLARAFAAPRSWVEVLERPRRPPTRDRLKDAPELAGFLWALGERGGGEGVVVKMDADLELSPEHFATVLGALEAEPELGMAGTFLHARRPDGTTYREEHAVQHVRGPTRFYRRRCLEEISPLPPLLGWDGADEVRARARGWHTRSLDLTEPPSFHLRPTGAHDGQLRAFARWGECAYAIGSHPLGVLAAAGYRARQRPRVLGGLAFVAGWAAAPLRQVERFPADIRTATRREQVGRLRRARRHAVGGGTSGP